jgi:hypothetical protein
MGTEPRPSDPIRDYLSNVWDTIQQGGDVSSVPKEEALEHVMELRRNNRPYEFPEKSKLLSLSDEDLVMAVMDWVQSRLKDWSNQYPEISSLPKPFQLVYGCKTVADQIHNGGFNQLFHNLYQSFNDSMIPFIEISIEGFKAFGVPELSEAIENSVQLYLQHKHILDPYYKEGTIESYSASRQEVSFDEQDKEFASKSHDIYVNIANYIRLNIDCYY